MCTSSDSYVAWYDVSWGYQAQPITPLTLMCGADTDTDKEPGLSQDALNGVTEGFHSLTYSKTFKTDSHTQQLKTGISKLQKRSQRHTIHAEVTFKYAHTTQHLNILHKQSVFGVPKPTGSKTNIPSHRL